MFRKLSAAFLLSFLLPGSLLMSQVVAAATDNKPSHFINTYYLHNSQQMQPRTVNHGVLTLTADGGRLLLPDADLALDWQVNAQQQIELIFTPKIASKSFPRKSCGDSSVAQKETHHIYQKMLINISDLTDKSARFSTTLTRLDDYVDAGCPDVTLEINQDSAVLTTAGLRSPLDFVEPGKDISMPISLKPAVLEPLTYPLVNGTADIRAAWIKFDEPGSAQSGSGNLKLGNVSSKGEWLYTTVPFLWNASPVDRTLSIRAIGLEIKLAYLGNDAAGGPMVSVMNTDPARQNSWNLPYDMDVGQKVLSWTAQNVPGIYEFRQIANAEATFNAFWLEFEENGLGIAVSTNDNNADGVLSSNEITQQPLRWQINPQGNLQVRRYKTARGADCLPDSFDPAFDASCTVYTDRNMTLLQGGFFNGLPVISVQHQYTFFNFSRQSNWPAQPVLGGVATIDQRAYFRLNTRPYPIKPLVLGLTIPDDRLRDCLLAKNLTSVSQLQSLTCQGVNNVLGLQHFTELQSLTLTGGNAMTELSQLKRLTKLNYLDLSNNQLNDSQIIQLDAMVMAPGGELKLANNFITLFSVNTLATMRQVDKLSLARNPLGSGLLLALFSDGNFVKELDLTGATLTDPITTLNMLAHHPSLTRLNLSEIGLTAVDGLNLPGALLELVLNGNPLTRLNLTGSTWSTLKTLSLNNTPLAELTFIAKMPALTTLYLDQTRLRQLNGLVGQLQVNRVFLRNTLAVACTDIAAALAADQQLAIYTDGCVDNNGIQLSLGEGLQLSSVEFADPTQQQLGQWRLVGQQLQFIPAANVQGWQRVTVLIRLSDGSSRTVTLDIYLQPQPQKPQRDKLPWWIYAKAA